MKASQNQIDAYWSRDTFALDQLQWVDAEHHALKLEIHVKVAEDPVLRLMIRD
jgi:hypothetical protein